MRKSATTLALSCALAGCGFVTPFQVTKVDVPNSNAVVRVEIWAGELMGDGDFFVAIQTPHGLVRRHLFQDWGPAQRVNLYLAPKNTIVAIGGGGGAEMFSIETMHPPAWIPYPQRPQTGGEDWKYLGVVDGYQQTFRPPSREAECIPLYGAGSSPYRKQYQNQHNC